MKTFDVTLIGYDGMIDSTDHLVKWINAEDKVSLLKQLDAWGLMPYIRSVDEILPWNINKGFCQFEDGVDVENGLTKDGTPFNPQIWINEVQNGSELFQSLKQQNIVATKNEIDEIIANFPEKLLLVKCEIVSFSTKAKHAKYMMDLIRNTNTDYVREVSLINN